MHEVTLSIIVTVVGGGKFLQRCLEQLISQIDSASDEILVPYDSTVRDIDGLKKQFSFITFVDMGRVETQARSGSQSFEHELYDRRSACGLERSRGDIIALLQDYCIPDRKWRENVVTAHQLPHGAIGGAVEHESDSALNWAVFFQDFGRHQLPLPEGRAHYLTDVNVSYKRSVLEPIKEVWQGRYKEVTVNWALADRGIVLWQSPNIVVRQDRGRLSLTSVIRERYHWGRLFGAIRTRAITTRRRLLYVFLAPAIPLILFARTAAKVLISRRHVWRLVTCTSYYLLLTTVWCLGEFVGNLTGSDSRR